MIHQVRQLSASILFCGYGAMLCAESKGIPRQNAGDYPVCVHYTEKLELCGEFMGRSVPLEGGVEYARSHIVIELGLLGPPAQQSLDQSGWSITINGSKRPITADPPSIVVSSLKDPIMSGPRTLAGGINDRDVVLGGPGRRLPPDVDPRRRGPAPPRAPEPEDRSGTKRPERSLDEQIAETGFPAGSVKTPLGGYLYFPYEGKLTGIKTLDLRYNPPETSGQKPVVLNLINRR